MVFEMNSFEFLEFFSFKMQKIEVVSYIKGSMAPLLWRVAYVQDEML